MKVGSYYDYILKLFIRVYTFTIHFFGLLLVLELNLAHYQISYNVKIKDSAGYKLIRNRSQSNFFSTLPILRGRSLTKHHPRIWEEGAFF